MTDAAALTLTSSLEDYLEAIYHIVLAKHAARAKDIAQRLNVKQSSVTSALQTLSGKRLINYAPYDVITLTKQGQKAAKDVVRRHEAIANFLTKVLAVKTEEAEEAACKLEHAISGSIMDRFIQYVEFVESCPRGGTKWIKGFGYHCESGQRDKDYCKRCIESCLNDFSLAKKGQGNYDNAQ